MRSLKASSLLLLTLGVSNILLVSWCLAGEVFGIEVLGVITCAFA